MLPRNIIQKIWDTHVVKETPGHPAIFAIDLQLLHEVTSPQAFQMLRERKLPVKFPDRCVATLDHAIPTRLNRRTIYDEQAKKQVEMLRENVKEFGVPFYDFDSGYQGIVHVIGPELGLTQPGMTIVCGDSHTSTHGAFGVMAFGVGTTEVGLVLATGCILQKKPKTMLVTFEGTMRKGVFSKDLILALIAQIGIGGGNGHIIEYAGSAIRNMSMEARMTICNMSIECGARAGIIAPDETTFTYIQGRQFAPKGKEWDKAVQEWQAIASDPGATYDKTVAIDVDQLVPMVTWGTNPSQGIPITGKIPRVEDVPEEQQLNVKKALEYTKLEGGQPIAGVKIDWAFLGSCTNARIEDLRIAASVLQGKKIHETVKMYVVPGSEKVRAQAEKEGLDQIFKDAGADWRMPGCSACLGMNDDKIPAGQRCISSSNRNFIGRQGPGSITHLASPATVVASAIAGEICSAEEYL